MDAHCWLCKEDVSSGLPKHKRRKIKGKANKCILVALENLAKEYLDCNLAADSSYRKATYLCYKCVTTINQFESKKAELYKIKDEIVSMLESSCEQLNMEEEEEEEEREEGNDESDSKVIYYSSFNTDDFSESLPSSTTTSTLASMPCTTAVTPTSTVRHRRKRRASQVNVNIDHKSGKRSLLITSPFTRENVKRVTRKEYGALSTSFVRSERLGGKLYEEVGRKCGTEIKNMCSKEANSSLKRYDKAALQKFSWDILWEEFQKNVPCLVKLIQCILSRKHKNNHVLISFILSIIVKSHSQKMATLQRAMSIFLYGKGVNKKVYKHLHPLMICMSHSTTIRLIETATTNHDTVVLQWAKNVSQQVQVSDSNVEQVELDLDFLNNISDNDEDDLDIHQTSTSPEPPPYSPVHSDEEPEDDNEKQSDPESGLNCSTNQCIEASESDSCQTMEIINENKWNGFKIVLDNVDKNFKASYERLTHSNKSLHYCNSFAMLDRIDFSGLSETEIMCNIDINVLLPNEDDMHVMRSHFVTLISRVLLSNVAKYAANRKEVEWHIKHKYTKEMSCKSVTVPLGVYPLNENKLDEMCQILDRLHVYCPVKESGEGTESIIDTLLGGDQLTSARVRTCRWLRVSHDDPKFALKSIIPVTEDWHTRMCLMKVIWIRLYNTKSGMDWGTLFHLKNVLNKRAISSDPSKNMKGCEDFLCIVMNSHIIAAAEEINKVSASSLTVKEVSELIVDKFVKFLSIENHVDRDDNTENIAADDCSDDDDVNEDNDNEMQPSSVSCNDDIGDSDQVYEYACEFLNLSLIWHSYHDAVREGDGDRVMMIWKYLLIFLQTKRTNYTKEVLVQLLQCNYLFSERKAAQLKWDRFVNTQGRIGCNIPADLHLEHLNKRFKGVLRNLGANIQPHSIARASKSLGFVHTISSAFEEVVDLKASKESEKHAPPKMEKDICKAVNILNEAKVFQEEKKRHHKSFTFKKGLLTRIDRNSIKQKLLQKADNAIIQI